MFKTTLEGNFPMTEEEIAELESQRAVAAKEDRRREIFAELATIDLKSIRALREGNQDRIDELEVQAAALRDELAGL